MKKMIICLMLISVILVSCGRMLPSADVPYDNKSPVVSSQDADSKTPSPPCESNIVETPVQTSAPPIKTPKEEDTTNSPQPEGSETSNIITPDEAVLLLSNMFDLDIKTSQDGKFDEDTGFLIINQVDTIVGYTYEYKVNLKNGDVYDNVYNTDRLVFNLLEDRSIYDIMGDLGIDKLVQNDPSPQGDYLFKRLFRELSIGGWYTNVYLKSIDNKETTGGGTDAYYFQYRKEDDEYTWGMPSMAGGVGGNITSVQRIKGTRRLMLSGNRIFYVEATDIMVDRLAFDEGELQCTRITDIDGYINNVMLLGIYKDKEGNTYEFTRQRKAIWPQGIFDYTLYNNDYWDECNPFMLKDVAYGFQWIDDKLYFYHIKPGQPMGYVRDEEPFLVLEQVSGPIVAPLDLDDFNIDYNGVDINDVIPFTGIADKLGIRIGEVDYHNIEYYGAGSSGSWYIVYYPSKDVEDMQLEYVVNDDNGSIYLVDIDLYKVKTHRGIQVGDSLNDLLTKYGDTVEPINNTRTTNVYFYKLDPEAEFTAPDKTIAFIVDKRTNIITGISINYNSNRAIGELGLSP